MEKEKEKERLLKSQTYEDEEGTGGKERGEENS